MLVADSEHGRTRGCVFVNTRMEEQLYRELLRLPRLGRNQGTAYGVARWCYNRRFF